MSNKDQRETERNSIDPMVRNKRKQADVRAPTHPC